MCVSVAAAAVPAAVGVTFLGRYGWDRDELYFLAASHHLALGYVDFPPLIAVLGRVVVVLFGTSLDALRISTLLLALVSVVIVGLCARELGGGVRAQGGAALAWATSPFLLGAASIFHPTWLDLAAQALVLYLVLLARRRPRAWIWAGVAAGAGLEAKYTIATLLGAIVLAYAASRDRAVLRSRGVVWAGAIALVLLVPNIAWEIAHGWPSAAFAASQRAKTAADTPPLTYLAEAIAFLGAAIVVGVVGCAWLWRRPGLRPLAVVPAIVFLGFGLEQGRAYYPLPALIVGVAAGGVALERWRPRRGWLRPAALAALVVVQLGVVIAAGPLVVPIRSTRSMISSGVADQSFFKDEIGWPAFVAQTAAAWHSLTPAQRGRAAILTANYGEAGALARFGDRYDLPPPLSGHLSWQYWRPARLPQRLVLTVGYDAPTLAALCTRHHRILQIHIPYGLQNDEQGRPVELCYLPRPLGALWQTTIANNDL